MQNLATGDDSDNDVKYNIATGNLNIDSGFGLHVWTGDTFAPGGDVATAGGGDIHINTSATLNTAGNDVSNHGYWDNDGTYTPGANTTTFNASETGVTIDAGSSSFNNVTFGGIAGAWWDTDWNRRNTVTITNTGSVQTDYAVQVDVTYDGDMQADFDDIRFYQ